MVHVQPTVHESNQFARTGKLPKSLKERRKLGESEDVDLLKEVIEKKDPNSPDYQVAADRLKELREQKRSQKAEPKADNKEAPSNEEEAGGQIESFEDIPEGAEFPFGYGGGYYFLSDGSKVRGEKAAAKAQAKLNEG